MKLKQTSLLFLLMLVVFTTGKAQTQQATTAKALKQKPANTGIISKQKENGSSAMKFVYDNTYLHGNTDVASKVKDKMVLPANNGIAKNYTAKPNKESMGETVIVDEDFSGLTKGTEDQPDNVLMNGDDGYVLNPELFKPYDPSCTKTWGGSGFYQAGGCLAVVNGFLNTPTGDYSGPLKMTFRARVPKGAANAKVDVILMRRSVLVDYKRVTINLTEDWQTFSFEADNGWYRDCMVQFFYMDDCTMLIDDIKIVHTVVSIEPPKALSPVNMKNDSFLALWDTTESADDYLLSVYTHKPNPDNDDTNEGFEGIKVTEGKWIDSADPQLPDGWKIDVTERGDKRHIYTEPEYCNNSKQAVCLDENGDNIESVKSRYPIKEVSLWLKADDRNQEGTSGSKLTIHALTDYGWKPWLFVMVQQLRQEKNGVLLRFVEETGLFDNIYQVKVEYNKAEGDNTMIAVDDVAFLAPGTPLFDYYWKDKVIEGRSTDSCEVTGLDPELDYYYSLKSRNAQFTSESSNEMEVYNAFIPQVEEATEVSDDAYTINWKSGRKADAFKIFQKLICDIEEDDEECVILQEDFSKVKSEGTAETPEVGAYNKDYVSIDAYTDFGGWTATSYSFADGMMGGMFPNGENLAGAIMTPKIDLSHNKGNFKVIIRAYALEGDFLCVQGSNPITFGGVGFQSTGFVTDTLEMTMGQKDDALTFYSGTYQPFMIDFIKIIQPVVKGDQLSVVDRVVTIADPSARSYRMEGVSDHDKYKKGYYMQSIRSYKGIENQFVFSDFSDIMYVNPVIDNIYDITNTSDDLCDFVGTSAENIIVTLQSAKQIEIYNINGVLVKRVSGETGENAIRMESGFYVVKIGNESTKVIVNK